MPRSGSAIFEAGVSIVMSLPTTRSIPMTGTNDEAGEPAVSDRRTLLLAEDDLFFSSSLPPAFRRLGFEPAIADAAPQIVERARALAPPAILINLDSRSLGSLD